jgi:hypothetical protein
MLLLLVLCGCRQLLGFEQVAEAKDSAVLDSEPVPDAAPCTELATSCASSSVLRTCTAVGELPVETVCNWGCLTDHCGALQPTGGAASAADLMVDATLVDIALTSGVINTDTGAITGVRPAGSGVRNGIGFEVRNGVGVFQFKKLSISGPVSVLGVRAVVLVANEDLVVSSTLVATGCVTGERSPGGSLGGAAATTGSGPGAGGGGANDALDGGGGGAGHGVAGGKGGNGGAALGGTGGAVYGELAIPLLSAAGGSGGGGGADANTGGGAGGAGGGAIQLISNTAISISGGINAGGCGGKKGAPADAGGGGGSGGTIVLEAPTVEIAGGVAVNGGGGGGGDGGSDGAPGQLASTEAAGGSPGGNGGGGGAGAALGSSGVGQAANRAGGGGGGVGWIRITTRDGTALITGFTSPALGSATATAAAAIVQ